LIKELEIKTITDSEIIEKIDKLLKQKKEMTEFSVD
jgi:hypothetical protein